MNQHQFDPEVVKKVRELNSVISSKGFFAIVLDYLIIIFSTFAVNFVTYPSVYFVYAIAVVLIASRMRALENLVHQASHNMIFSNRKLNYWVGFLVCALPIGTSFSAYKKSHMTHHKNLGKKNDPDYIRYTKLGIPQASIPRNTLIKKFFGLLFVVGSLKYIADTFSSFLYSSDERRVEAKMRIFLYVLIAAFVVYFHLYVEFFLFWIVPFLTVFQLIRFLSELSEHAGLYQKTRAIERTRNNLCHPVLQFLLFPHNDHLHLVHHIFPAVPFYHLKKAHEILMNDPTYAGLNHCSGYFLSKYPNVSTLLQITGTK